MPKVQAPGAPDEMATIEWALHRLMKAVGPNLRVERKWENDWYVGTDLICCIGSFTHHVGVEFWRGRSLVEAGHPLEGTGKNLRNLKVRTLEEARAPTTRRTLVAAVRLDARSPKRGR